MSSGCSCLLIGELGRNGGVSKNELNTGYSLTLCIFESLSIFIGGCAKDVSGACGVGKFCGAKERILCFVVVTKKSPCVNRMNFIS